MRKLEEIVKVRSAQIKLGWFCALKSRKSVAEYSNRMLSGVATRFGKDSNEYEAAGGVRKSERKKPQRKPKA